MIDDLQSLKKKRIRKLINETQETLAELTAELDRRKTEKQEYEVEHLENHMENTEASLTIIRNFLSFLTNHRDKENGTDK